MNNYVTMSNASHHLKDHEGLVLMDIEVEFIAMAVEVSVSHLNSSVA